MTDPQHRLDQQDRRAVLGEYELEGGAFGPAAGSALGRGRGRGRGDQRNNAEAGGQRALARPGSLWRAVLRRIRTV